MGIRIWVRAASILAGAAILPGVSLLQPPAYAGGIVIVQKNAEPVKSGKSVPIFEAIKEIAPPGYTIVMGDGISPDEKVSWTGAGDWLGTLNRLHSESGTAYGVSLKGHDLHLRNLDAAADSSGGPSSAGNPIVIDASAPVRSPGVTFLTAPRPAQAPAPALSTAPVVSSSLPPPTSAGAPADPSSPVPASQPPSHMPGQTISQLPAPPRSRPATPINEDLAETSSGQVWHATAGKYLSDIIEDWAEKAGWQVVYDTRMLYEVGADSDFEGSFSHAAWTMIHQMQQQIKMAGAEKPFPDIYFWKNRTAVIVTHRGLQD